MPRVGAIGLFVVILINIFVLIAYDKSSAVVFSSIWWSIWFPSYIVWFVLLCMGITLKFFDHSNSRK